MHMCSFCCYACFYAHVQLPLLCMFLCTCAAAVAMHVSMHMCSCCCYARFYAHVQLLLLCTFLCTCTAAVAMHVSMHMCSCCCYACFYAHVQLLLLCMFLCTCAANICAFLLLCTAQISASYTASVQYECSMLNFSPKCQMSVRWYTQNMWHMSDASKCVHPVLSHEEQLSMDATCVLHACIHVNC